MLEMWSNFAKTGDAFNIEYPLLDIEQNTTRYKIQLKHRSKMEYYADDDRIQYQRWSTIYLVTEFTIPNIA